MNGTVAIRSQPQAAKTMQPRNGAFRNPTINAQAAPMLGVSFGDLGNNATPAQFLAQALRIISPVHVDFFRPFSRSPRLARDRWHAVDQRQRFIHVRLVGARGVYGQRDPLGVGEDVVLGAQFASICRVWSRLIPPLTGADTVALSSDWNRQSMPWRSS